MQNIKKYFMTLALLITAVGGAWADETPLLTIESKDYASFLSGSKTFDDKVTVTFSSSVENNGDADGWFSIAESLLTVAGTNGYTITSCKFYTNAGTAKTGYTVAGESPSVYLSAGMVFTDASETVYLGDPGITKIEVYGAAPATEWSLKPDETGKKWTLDKMPASNVELQVEYYAESNLFLSKDALADKANIAVTAGETTVEFDDDGKSAKTVTEGNTVTAKFTGKKVLGMKVEKKGGAVENAYQKWDADQKKLVATEIPTTAIKVENANAGVEWQAGTYVVDGEVNISGTITLSGDVNLIIKDGAKLTAQRISGNSKNLSIYGQAQMTGELVVNSETDNAIKSINTLEVHSAKVTATSSGNNRGGFDYIGTINVYGGEVDAKNTAEDGGYGIGLKAGGFMNIYGGEVKAEGKGDNTKSNGINGSDPVDKATVTVYGGKLWAGNADDKALRYVTLTIDKSLGFNGEIETSPDNSTWNPTVGTPDAKYVRVGY